MLWVMKLISIPLLPSQPLVSVLSFPLLKTENSFPPGVISPHGAPDSR
jgi:hypothetical protein